MSARRLLVVLVLATGCRTWDVNAFGVPVGKQPRHIQASSMTTDETIGVIVVLTAIVGLTVWAAVEWGDDCGCP